MLSRVSVILFVGGGGACQRGAEYVRVVVGISSGCICLKGGVCSGDWVSGGE